MKAFFTGAMKILKVLTQAPKDVIDTDVELVYDQTTIGHGKDYLEVIFRHPTEKWSFQARIRKEDAPAFLEHATWLAMQTGDTNKKPIAVQFYDDLMVMHPKNRAAMLAMDEFDAVDAWLEEHGIPTESPGQLRYRHACLTVLTDVRES